MCISMEMFAACLKRLFSKCCYSFDTLYYCSTQQTLSLAKHGQASSRKPCTHWNPLVEVLKNQAIQTFQTPGAGERKCYLTHVRPYGFEAVRSRVGTQFSAKTKGQLYSENLEFCTQNFTLTANFKLPATKVFTLLHLIFQL